MRRFRPTPSLVLAMLVATAVATQPAGAELASSLTYTPLAPCRIYDSRPGSGVQGEGSGPLNPGVIRRMNVRGLCDVAEEARAVVLNLVAVNPGGAGHLTMWPWEDANVIPTASVLNFSPGMNLANGLVVTLCEPGEQADGTCDFDLKVVAAVQPAHLVIDVMGYFIPPGYGRLWGEGRPGSERVYGFVQIGFPERLCTNTEADVQFGLSAQAVLWADAPSACPAGFWVCTYAERGFEPCNTARDDSASCDVKQCDGACLDLAPNQHNGFVADSYGSANNPFSVHAVREDGTGVLTSQCNTYPVWCCRR